jgi:DNA-directed RNA polymerase specialized sigma24 family protein
MLDHVAFRDLIQRMRAGDEAAATELVRRYEPAIRLAVRARLTDPAARRVLDSVDICQMVLASFFERATRGHYELTSPEQLLHLLKTMARNKLIKEIQTVRTRRRGGHLIRKTYTEETDFTDPHPEPDQEVANRELLELFHSRLSAEERWVNEQRLQGRSWSEIAGEVGGNPDALRMHYDRRMKRVAHELQLIG